MRHSRWTSVQPCQHVCRSGAPVALKKEGATGADRAPARMRAGFQLALLEMLLERVHRTRALDAVGQGDYRRALSKVAAAPFCFLRTSSPTILAVSSADPHMLCQPKPPWP